ncbi:DUF418 domain-containing protein [Ruania zhangjianzhongii]|uniref:DUF418 domain-containing protein n=1 Tax=Ruania zhangjianzhongii TaxID=2603206 RepID=UPI0011CA29D6|nr:DUF418 domain-containing protein [Ruania zhangjianzhongii]
MVTTSPPNLPPGRRPRFLAPDLARGVMLAMIALANVMIYLHGRPYGLRQQVLTDSGLDRAVGAGVGLFVDARAYPLFAALFGYGIVQMIRSRQARGVAEDEIRRIVRRRSVGLILFGGVHALLAFSGDILGWYGLIGLALVRLLRLRDRALLRLAIIWLAVAAVIQGAIFADPTPSMQRSYFWSYAIPDPLEAAGWRIVEWVTGPFGLLAVVSAMLVGVWAGRHRILEQPQQHRRLLVRTAVIGLSIGILGGAGSTLVGAGLWSPPVAVAAALAWLHVVSGVFCGLGYAALLALLAARLTATGRDRHWSVRALQATGQKSLSCYLAQSIVFATLLAASTLGWGAHLGPAGAAALALLTWAGTVAAAAATAGRMGPAETLLKKFVRGPRLRARATISG